MTETILKKRLITLNVFATGMDRVYDGRLLGLIDDGEFNHLLSSRETQKKCKTRGTMTIKEIVDNHQELDGLRLMMVVHEINEKTTAPYLFISERLHYVSYVKPNSCCGFTGESQSYLMVEERME